jgi:ADP-ribose pyrophosphatase YjhB (NUDIX family)
MRRSDLPLLDARLLYEKIDKSLNVARWPKGTPKGGQFAPKGAGDDASGDLFHGSTKTAHGVLPKGAILHPQHDDLGNAVVVHSPTPASSSSTWHNPGKTATFTPGGKTPDAINGVPLTPWHDAPTDHEGWKKVEGTNPALEHDAPFAQHPTKYSAAGVIIHEPDGRVWLTKPTNQYGGYQHTFPKGGAEMGLTMQQNAIKEAYEETGLKVRITGVLGDYDRDTSRARMYTAERVGGTPKDMGWETQAMRLVPREQLQQYLNKPVDKGIAADFDWETPHPVQKGYNPNQARWPKGSPLGGQFKAAGADGFTEPPKIGSATNPTYQKIAQGMHKAAAAGDWKHVQAAVDKLSAKVAMHGGKAQLNSHDKWAAQAHQYGKELLAEKESKTQAVASATKLAGPAKLSEWKKVGSKPGGSSDGALYTDPHGQKWLVKSYGDDDMAKSEVLASHLLNAAGAKTADMQLVELGGAHKGGLGVASKWVDGAQKLDAGDASHVKAAQKDFAAHAWLANWDSIGLAHDNTVMHGGHALHIDPGGALEYRATGGKKGAAFGTEVGELDTMRDATKNASAASVYGGMTHSDIAESAKGVLALSPRTIGKLVNTYGPGDAAHKAALTAKLLARQQDLAAKVGAPENNHHSSDPASSHHQNDIETQSVQKPAFFASSAGGKHYNAIADELEAAHAAGNKAAVELTLNNVPTNTVYGKKIHAYGDAIKADLAAKNSSATPKAETHVEAAAAHAAAAKAPIAVPAKPDKLSSAANPNLGLLKKVDDMHAHAQAYADGKIEQQAAIDAIKAHSFGSNTFGKKAAAYQADLLAALGSSKPAEVGEQLAAHKSPEPAAPVKPAKKAPVFDPGKLTSPPNFLSWGATGKPGPSSNEAVNQANHWATHSIYEAAKTGKPEAIDALKLPLINKTTGEKTDVSPLAHPSQHVKGYALQMKNEIDAQLNPPKTFRFTDGHPLKALDAMYPTHKGATAGSGIKNVGKYIELGAPGKLGQPLEMPHITEANGKLSTSTYAAQAKAAFSKLPSTQQEAVKSYTGSGYHEINSSLWKGAPNETAKSANAAIHTVGHEIAPGTVLSRKISVSGEDLHQILNSTGKVLQEPAIMSTSISPKVWGGNVHLKLTVGPGVKGLYVGQGSSGTKGSISHFSGEKEILLPANTRLHIQKVETAPAGGDKDGFGNGPAHIVHAIVLPTHSSDKEK